VSHANVLAVPAGDTFTANDSPSLQFLPRQQEAPGWRLEQDPVVVPRERLLTYLDNDGPHFAHYEVVDLTQGKYAAVANPQGFATVEIFRFPDFVKSFGAYSTRKKGPITFLPIQNETFEAPHSINIWRGPFYVRVIGGGTNDGNDSLRRLASFVADKMPAAPGKPAVFNFFPTTGRLVNMDRYSTESGLGQTFLGNSFQATFDIAGVPIEGLIIPATNREAAANLLNTYKALYVSNGKLLDPIPNLGEDNFTAEDRYLGRTVAFRIDRFLVAFNGYKDRQALVDIASTTDQRVLGSIRKQLVTADKLADQNDNGSSRKNNNLPAWAQPH
jgi:hypothetical protein